MEFKGVLSDVDAFLEPLIAQVNDQVNGQMLVETRHTNNTPALANSVPDGLAEDKAVRVCHIQGFPLFPVVAPMLKRCKIWVPLRHSSAEVKKAKLRYFMR